MERRSRRVKTSAQPEFASIEKSSSPSRKSPSRNAAGRKSPSRKKNKSQSPVIGRKSPSRIRKKSVSPIRKSPSRNKPKDVKNEKTSPKPTRKTRASPRDTTDIKPETILGKVKLDKEYIEQKMSPKVSLRSLKTDQFVKPSKISPNKSAKLEDSGDFEVSKLTFNIDNLTPEPSQYSNMTPTATDLGSEKSRSMSRSLSRSVYDEGSDNEQENDDAYQTKREFATRNIVNQFKNLDEFGGRIGVIILSLLVPTLCLYLNHVCNEKTCNLIVPDIKQLSTFQVFLNSKIAIIFLLFTWGISIISAIPIGRIVQIYVEEHYVEYNFNGWSSALITLIGLGVAEYLKYPIIDLIYQNYFQLCVLNVLYAVFIGFVSYLRSKYIVDAQIRNPYGLTGKFLVDLYAGPEISPKLFRILDTKLVRIRVAIITTFILNGIFIYKNLELPSLKGDAVNGLSHIELALHVVQNTTFNSTALLAASLILIYASDLLIFEHHLTNSFELQHEGVGLHFLNRYAVFPFMISLLARHTLEHDIKTIPIWGATIIILCFLFGIYLKRSSNKLKYEYRLNPTLPKFRLCDSIPTFQSKRLLLAGLWAKIRHPNHTGDIISMVSLLPILCCGFSWPPALALIYLIIVFVHRAIRVDRRNSQKYNASWTRYCSRAQHLIIPKVF